MPSEKSEKTDKKRQIISSEEFAASLGITREILGGVQEKDVAAILGVNVQSIRAWRRGRTNVSKPMRWALYGLCALAMMKETGVNPLDRDTWPVIGG